MSTASNQTLTAARLPIAIALGVFVADQLTKTWARSALELCTTPAPSQCVETDLPGPVNLLLIENGGSALGYAQGLLVWTVLAAAALLLLRPIARRGGPAGVVGAALLAGGALGNLLDRILFGAVTDFIVLGYVIANIADLALLAGATIATIALARTRQPQATARTGSTSKNRSSPSNHHAPLTRPAPTSGIN